MAVGAQGRVVCQSEAGRGVNRADRITHQVRMGDKVSKGEMLIHRLGHAGQFAEQIGEPVQLQHAPSKLGT